MLSKIGFGVEHLKDFFARTFMNEPQRVPKEIVIEVTSRCNLNCYFCFNKTCIKKRDSIPDMPTNKIKTIIDEISKSPIKKVRFSGGEPLLRKDILELLKYARSKGLTVWLNTNATLVRDYEAKTLAKYVDNVLVPLNSFNHKDERLVTGKNLFSHKIKGIGRLKSAGLKKVRAGTVATKKNIKNLEAFHNFVKKLDVDDWELFRPIPVDKINITSKDVKLLVEKLILINQLSNSNYLIRNALPICSYIPEKVDSVSLGAYSDDGHTRMIVDFRGFLKPAYYTNKNVGLPEQGIMNVWNNEFMKGIRQLKDVSATCKKCKYLTKCKGGSRVAAKVIKGHYKNMDHLARPDKYQEFLFQ